MTGNRNTFINNYSLKISVILATYLFIIAWGLRYYSTWAGSPVPGGWGVNIDWSRSAIVSTGYIQEGYSSSTILSSYAGTQSYDWGTIIVAVINIIIGPRGLEYSLRVINSAPVLGLGAVPIFGVWFFKNFSELSEVPRKNYAYVLVTALCLFPSPGIIDKTSIPWHTETYATSILLISLILVTRRPLTKRHIILLLLLSIIALNSYHTWAFIYILIIGTVLLLKSVTSFYRSAGKDPQKWSPLFILLSITLSFFIVGNWINHRFVELFETFYQSILLSGSDTYFSASGSDLVGSSTSQIFSNLNLRRYFYLIFYTSSLLIILLYVVTTCSNIYRTNRYYFEHNPYDETVFYGILSFPAILTIFYSIGGFVTAVGRASYIGAYFVVLASASMISKFEGNKSRLIVVLVVVLAVSSSGGYILTGSFIEPAHTDKESRQIKFLSAESAESSYIVSDTVMVMPLLYSEHQGPAAVQAIFENWESIATDIYYSPNNSKQAIVTLSSQSTIGQSISKKYYFVTHESMTDKSIRLLSFSMKPSPNINEYYNNDDNFQKVYSSGDNSVIYFSYDNA